MNKFFFFVLILTATLFAQNSKFDSLVTTGIGQIYNIKFSEAEKTFGNLINDYPKHPSGIFFLAMIDWWKILLLDSDDERFDDKFYDKI